MSWNNIIPAFMLVPEEKEMGIGETEQSNEHLKNLERDAKRYRFVRQFGNPDYDPGFEPPAEPQSPEEFDAAVDDVIRKTGFERADW